MRAKRYEESRRKGLALFRSWVGVALGMLAAIASAVSGVLLLVRPYVSADGALVAAALATVPLVVLWRFLALGEPAPRGGRSGQRSSLGRM